MPPPGRQTFLASPIPSVGGRVIVSPFQFLVTGEDNLRVEGWNVKAGCTLLVSWRFAELSGDIHAYERTVVLTDDRVRSRVDIPLGVGYIVNLAVFAANASPIIGQTFTSIKLIRGLGGATVVLGLLVQGYVTSQQGLGWPGSPIMSSIEGRGSIRRVTGTDPAAGVEITESVPTGARWRVETMNFVLVTSAAGSPRFLLVIADDGALITLQHRASQSHPISTSANYTVSASGYASLVTANNIPVAIPPDLLLFGGYRLRTATSGLDSGDNFGAPQFLVEEWLEVDA